MQVAAAIRAVLEFAADEPVAAHVLTVESLAQGSSHFARHRRPVDHLAPCSRTRLQAESSCS
jgi:hypothetical protein